MSWSKINWRTSAGYFVLVEEVHAEESGACEWNEAEGRKAVTTNDAMDEEENEGRWKGEDGNFAECGGEILVSGRGHFRPSLGVEENIKCRDADDLKYVSLVARPRAWKKEITRFIEYKTEV